MNADLGLHPDQGPTLPPGAPRIRITAGVGTSAQKTWNVRRPVTVIGSGRSATIVLSDPAVSKAHCAIVNTGDAVLLKDLCSDSGTLLNAHPVRLAILRDGDVLSVAGVRIQVAIQQSPPRCGETQLAMQLADPLHPPESLSLGTTDGRLSWSAQEPVVLIGRRSGATIHLDHPDVSLAHALLVRLQIGPVLCDLGSRTGTTINGRRVALSLLNPGDQIGIGPFQLHRVAHAAREPAVEAVPDSRETELFSREAQLHRRSGQLDEREVALIAKAAELDAREQRLRERERQLRMPSLCQTLPPSLPLVADAASTTVAPAFTATAASAECPVAPTPDSGAADIQSTLEHVSAALAQMRLPSSTPPRAPEGARA